MRWLARIAKNEALRLTLSRRSAVAVALCAIAAYLAAGDVRRASLGAVFTPNAWDVHAAAVNSFMYIGYLALVGYVALIGTTLVDDRESGLVWLVLPRLKARVKWWAGKVGTVVLMALALQILLLIFCLLFGVLRNGGSLGVAASHYATGGTEVVDSGGVMLFAPVAPETNMALREGLLTLYESFAFSAIGTFLLALTVRFSRAFLPITLALLGLLADYVVGRYFREWVQFSPGRRLLESIHATSGAGKTLTWWSSVVYWTVLFALSTSVGGWVLRRADI